MKKKTLVAAARHVAAVMSLACAAHANAAVQMLLPHSGNSTKAAPVPPADMRSSPVAVRFNAAELNALALGSEVELTLPNATTHTFVFDQKVDHGNGNISWIGYYRDHDQRLKLNAIVTTGPDGSIGLIQTPGGDFSIRQGQGGNDWLVDLKAERPRVDLAHDTRQVKVSRVKESEPLASPSFADVIPGVTVPASSVLPTSAQTVKTAVIPTVDLLLVYNASLAASVNITTFAAQLQSEANQAYANSGVNMTLHVVGTMLLPYSDTLDNGAVLTDITGTNAFNQVVGSPNNTAIEAKRAQVGADIVAFYRGGDGATTGGSNFGAGLAWAPNSAMSSFWKPYMYSATVGCWGGCEFIWIHEVGHNMGNMHDRATNAWETSGAAQDDGDNNGSYPYSWGFYTCNGRYDNAALTCNAFGGGCTDHSFDGKPNCNLGISTNNYRDLMAYFHESTNLLLQFSNPNLTCAGSGLACGVADLSTDPNMPGRHDSADTARSMNANAVALSGLVAPPAGGGTGIATTSSVASNYNPAQVGSAFTFIGTVSSTSGTPTGSLAFKYNGTVVPGCAAVTVSGGIAFCTATGLPAGPLSITVQFTGTGGYSNSTSTILTQYMVAVPSMIATSPRKVDFDGDHRGDLGWRGPGGLWGTWLMAGASYGPTAYAIPPVTGSVLRAIGDFTGDGKSDLLWRNPDNSYVVTAMNGTSQGTPVTIAAANSGWDVIGVGDFNGDHTSDLLWASVSGQYRITLMNAGAIGTTGILAAPVGGYYPAFIGDFSGDTKDDLLWRATDGSLTVMLVDGVANAGQAQLIGANTWFPTQLADFNGDSKADILLAKSDGSVAAWLMSAGSIIGGAVLQDTHGVPNGWTVALARDLDGDGKDDLIWRNGANGTYGGWLMNGVQVKAYGTIFNTPNSGWSIVAAGDYNADGRIDLMWKHTNGQFSTWLMNGFNAIGYGSVLGAGTGWDLAP